MGHGHPAGEPTGQRTRSLGASARLLDVVAAALCAAALATAIVTVRGLRGPYADDHFRDIAQAQSALDGRPFADPYYAGERIWYNPLVPWLVAAGARAFETPPATFHVQAGPWLNLLAPLAFYALVVRLAGRGAALPALLIFLFVNGQTGYGRDHATYSPWLFVANFAQGLFYLGMLALVRFRRRPGIRQAVVVGVLGGLTFLAHTGPAILLALLALLTIRGRALAASAAAGVLVASPFLYCVLVFYGARVLNPAPLQGGLWMTASAVRFHELLLPNALLLALAAGGLVLARERLLRAWLAVSLALLSYGVWCDVVPGLPRLVPTFHFWRFASAAMTVYAGAAVWWLIQHAARERAAPVAAAAALVATVAVFPRYLGRPDFWGRAIAQRRPPSDGWLTERLRGVASPGEAVLASPRVSLEVVGPAGRHVVALHPVFSNPYVDVRPRARARDAMFAALEAGNAEGFLRLAEQYRVGYVIGTSDSQCRGLNRFPLALVDQSRGACVLTVAR